MPGIEMKEYYFDCDRIDTLEDAREQLQDILDSDRLIDAQNSKYLWMEYAWVLEKLIEKELHND